MKDIAFVDMVEVVKEQKWQESSIKVKFLFKNKNYEENPESLSVVKHFQSNAEITYDRDLLKPRYLKDHIQHMTSVTLLYYFRCLFTLLKEKDSESVYVSRATLENYTKCINMLDSKVAELVKKQFLKESMKKEILSYRDKTDAKL